jgi:hypothetical protein
MIILIILMIASYILSNLAKKKLEDKNEEEYKKLKLAQNIIFIILLILSVSGFTIYLIEKYIEYKGQYSILKFVFGNPKCRKYTPSDAKIL